MAGNIELARIGAVVAEMLGEPEGCTPDLGDDPVEPRSRRQRIRSVRN
jgi:hypothetical protein